MQPIVEPILSMAQVLELTGLSYRELDYGVRHGTLPCSLPASGSGHVRRYTLPDLVGIAAAVTRRDLALQIDPYSNQRRSTLRRSTESLGGAA